MTAPLDPRRDRHPAHPASVGSALRAEVLRGLRGTPKTLPAKLFYDERGARLFERICTLDEYYLTRTELAILRASRAEIAALAGPRCALIEYGSGAGVKVRLLLDALAEPVAYVPIDISREQLARVAREIAALYPDIAVQPLRADYTTRFELPPLPRNARRFAFFPGSTIGNFHPAEAAAFLRRIRRVIRPDGALLLGVDRVKDPAVLDAAYNDRDGVTAAFNLNMLARLNHDLGATFDLARFRHHAFYDPHAARVEMHLVSTARQEVHVAGEPVTFERGETIWTESSYKYDRSRLDRVATAAGFGIGQLWTDPGDQFWVVLLVPAPSEGQP